MAIPVVLSKEKTWRVTSVDLIAASFNRYTEGGGVRNRDWDLGTGVVDVGRQEVFVLFVLAEGRAGAGQSLFYGYLGTQ